MKNVLGKIAGLLLILGLILPVKSLANSECTSLLMDRAGVLGVQARQEIHQAIRQGSVSKDPEFLKYVAAVIYTESGFRPEVISSQEAAGLMQVTEVAMKDTVDHCGLPEVSMDLLLSSQKKNVKYGTCYLNHMLQYTGGSWTRTLIIYNGGYRQLARYDRGESIATETANYVLKVKRAFNLCN